MHETSRNSWTMECKVNDYFNYAKFGQTERSASFMSVQPSSKFAYHLLNIVSDEAEST